MTLPRPFGPSPYRTPHRGLLQLLAALGRGGGASEQIFYGEFDGLREKRVLISPTQERRATGQRLARRARSRKDRVRLISE